MIPPEIFYAYSIPREIPEALLGEIEALVRGGGAVGTAWIHDTLRGASLVAWASFQGKVIGSSTHKRPSEAYRKKIEAATGVDLTGYLERGYTVVDPAFRGRGIGERLVLGLMDRSLHERIYVTIRLDNIPPLRMTFRAGMVLAGRFVNGRTGNVIGLFVNR